MSEIKIYRYLVTDRRLTLLKYKAGTSILTYHPNTRHCSAQLEVKDVSQSKTNQAKICSTQVIAKKKLSQLCYVLVLQPILQKKKTAILAIRRRPLNKIAIIIELKIPTRPCLTVGTRGQAEIRELIHRTRRIILNV